MHPDKEQRTGTIVHGVDVAKKADYTVFYSVNLKGRLVGYSRFNHMKYTSQVIRLKTYLLSFFSKSENYIKYDTTGVGEAFGDILSEANINAAIEPVLFTNKSKSEMVTKTIVAIQSGYHKAPLIRAIEKEFTSFEVTNTASGLFRYAAPEGEHDDIVMSAIMAVSEAQEMGVGSDSQKIIEEKLLGKKIEEDDIINAYENIEDLEKEAFEYYNTPSEDESDFELDLENA